MHPLKGRTAVEVLRGFFGRARAGRGEGTGLDAAYVKAVATSLTRPKEQRRFAEALGVAPKTAHGLFSPPGPDGRPGSVKGIFSPPSGAEGRARGGGR